VTDETTPATDAAPLTETVAEGYEQDENHAWVKGHAWEKTGQIEGVDGPLLQHQCKACKRRATPCAPGVKPVEHLGRDCDADLAAEPEQPVVPAPPAAPPAPTLDKMLPDTVPAVVYHVCFACKQKQPAPLPWTVEVTPQGQSVTFGGPPPPQGWVLDTVSFQPPPHAPLPPDVTELHQVVLFCSERCHERAVRKTAPAQARLQPVPGFRPGHEPGGPRNGKRRR
jgi:hypothetical protein